MGFVAEFFWKSRRTLNSAVLSLEFLALKAGAQTKPATFIVSISSSSYLPLSQFSAKYLRPSKVTMPSLVRSVPPPEYQIGGDKTAGRNRAFAKTPVRIRNPDRDKSIL
jgi:hypothetical protein